MAIFEREQEIRSRTVNNITHGARVSSQSGIKDVLARGELPNFLRKWIIESVSRIELQSRPGLQAELTPSANIIETFHDGKWILQDVGINDALATAGAEATERLSTKEFAFETHAVNQGNLPIGGSSPAIDDAIETPVLPADVAAEVERRGMILIFAA